MKQTVVLLPGLGMGHITPMVELAKLFTDHHFAVTIVLIDSPFAALSAISPYIARVSSSFPSISFHRLPKLSLPSRPANSNPALSMFDVYRSTTPHLSHFLNSFLRTTDIRALIIDFFCIDALDVGIELRIPSYFFFATSVSNLAAFLFFPTLQSQLGADLKDLGDDLINIPGLVPVPASHMVHELLERNNEIYDMFLYIMKRFPEADGLVCNTFEALEKRAVQAVVDGVCVPDQAMPPIYCIGPIVAKGEVEEKHECLKWLDAQAKGSVVFLCFGSMGNFSAEQLKEIAIGLESSDQRFLWVVRSPRSSDPVKLFEPLPEPNLELLMPDGFLERTEGRGMVVKSWAPQKAVLGHESVGGFVSHCGWNSVLEAVSTGVPIIAWPLYAEQRMNKVFLTEEAKLAVEMKGYDKETVSAEEVETKLRWVMESEGGKELRDRAMAMKENATVAKMDGGSSDKMWMSLVNALDVGKMKDRRSVLPN